MMMQHKAMSGQQIAIGTGERFEDRMKRIAMSYRSDAAAKVSDDSPWITLRVDSGREKAVKNSLDDHQIEVLVPMRKGPEMRKRGRVIPAVLIPVMACYVLVRCRITDRALCGLKSFDHVRGVLGGWEHPVPTSAEKVRIFNASADEGQYDWERPVTRFKRGDKVKVKEGSFEEMAGEIVSCRVDGKGDAVVDFPGYRFVRPATIPLALLEKL